MKKKRNVSRFPRPYVTEKAPLSLSSGVVRCCLLTYTRRRPVQSPDDKLAMPASRSLARYAVFRFFLFVSNDTKRKNIYTFRTASWEWLTIKHGGRRRFSLGDEKFAHNEFLTAASNLCIRRKYVQRIFAIIDNQLVSCRGLRDLDALAGRRVWSVVDADLPAGNKKC